MAPPVQPARERYESKLSEETSSDLNPGAEPLFGEQRDVSLPASAAMADTAILAGATTVPAPARRSGQRRRRPKVSIPGVLVVAGIIGSGVLVTEWPLARWLVYAAWMMPMLELALLAAGQVWFRWRFRLQPRKGNSSTRSSRSPRRAQSTTGSANYRPDPVLSAADGPPSGWSPSRATAATTQRRPRVGRPEDSPQFGAQGPRVGVSRQARQPLGYAARRESHLQRRRRDADEGLHLAALAADYDTVRAW